MQKKKQKKRTNPKVLLKFRNDSQSGNSKTIDFANQILPDQSKKRTETEIEKRREENVLNLQLNIVIYICLQKKKNDLFLFHKISRIVFHFLKKRKKITRITRMELKFMI